MGRKMGDARLEPISKDDVEIGINRYARFPPAIHRFSLNSVLHIPIISVAEFEGGMIREIFKELDSEIFNINKELRKSGTLEIARFYIKVLGQIALIEAKIGLHLVATLDVDAYANFDWLAKKAFIALLAKRGQMFDELSSEIWMPEDTQYELVHKGDTFDGYIARHEFVLLSKRLKAPFKNKGLILEYLSKNPTVLFTELCQRHNVDLKGFVRNA